MGVRILAGQRINESGKDSACLYDSVTGFAFGPLLYDANEAQSFLDYIKHEDGRDSRSISDIDMTNLLVTFRAAKEFDWDGSSPIEGEPVNQVVEFAGTTYAFTSSAMYRVKPKE